MGDIMGGVLATILSTPCSAPFLGTALAFAFASSPLLIMTIFFFIGLGLSAPFLLTAAFPQMLILLPRPGQWMDDLKKFLGMTLLLTLIWLYDIFLSLIDDPYFSLLLNLTLATLFFALYFHHRMSQRTWMKILFYSIPILLFILFLNNDFSVKNGEKTVSDFGRTGDSHDLQWRPWSEKAMKDLKGELVFIDFTAQWCFTCKVNEKLVLNTRGFKKLVKEKNVKLLLGDWTRRDPVIAEFLNRHGHVGVPVYFVQKRSGELVSLGETISLGENRKSPGAIGLDRVEEFFEFPLSVHLHQNVIPTNQPTPL